MTQSTLIPENEGQSTYCPECRKPDYVSSSWCKYCGYYGVLGRKIDIDSSFEQECESYEDPVAAGGKDPTIIDGIMSIPFWFWQIGAGVIGITIMAIYFHLTVEVGSALRIVGAVGMVFLGVMTFALAHLYAGIEAIKQEFDFDLIDIAISPLRIWTSVFARMPFTFKRTFFACSGLWTVVVAHLIVGVPYMQLRDLSAPGKKFNPMDMISGMAPSGDSDMTMEEAMAALAAKEEEKKKEEEEPALTLEQALSEVMGELKEAWASKTEEEKKEPEPETLTLNMSASIIGYTLEIDTGAVQSLVVAVRSDGRWRVAGSVFGVTPEMSDNLKTQLELIQRDEPFIKNELSATWVEPILRCSIEAQYSKAEDTFSSLSLLKLQ